ncbi:MAG: DUF4097 family beta strand repeat-containing protein [bacterium]
MLNIRLGWLLACLLLLTAAVGRADEYTFNYQKMVPTSAPIELTLDLATGSVFVTGSTGDQLIVEAVKRVRAVNQDEAEEVADHIEIRVDQNGERISIATNYLKLGSRKKSFWRKLFGSGSDSYGDVEYRIILPQTKAITIKSMSAQVELASVEAEITVENAAGSTRGEFLFGSVNVAQPTGIIDLQWVEGDIRVKATSAMVTIVQMQGALDLTTRTGGISIRTELNSPKDFYVETETGAISIAVPEMSSGQLSIQTKSGDISTDVPIAIKSADRYRLVGEFGAGGPKISLSSSSGDVAVALY